MQIKLVSVLITSLLLSGCSLAPKMSTPKSELPASQKNIVINVQWWKQFNDENLNKLIVETLKNNDDLKLAVANVQKARAQYGISKADMYPQLNLNAAGSVQRKSVNAYLGRYGGIYKDFSLSASVAYELDFWAKAYNQKRANLALLLATDENKESLKISLITDVSTYYFNLIAISKQLEITKNTLKSYEEIYKYRQMQYTHGVIDKLVVAQVKAQVASAKSQLNIIKANEIKVKSTLVLLLGRTPKEIFKNILTTSTKFPESIKIPVGLPANILQNRPDVQAAQEILKSKTALIGVAKAAYFPAISLTGNLGYQSQMLSNLLGTGSQIWGVAPTISFPLFDFGRIAAAVKITKADQKAALISYDKVVKIAYTEVYEALETIKISKEQQDSVKEEVAAYNDAYEIAKKKFNMGTVSSLDVLNAQNSLLSAKLSYVKIQAQLLSNEATLYKVFGGGWKQTSDNNDTQ